MIIWINGLFGVGKSTTARRLCDALEDALLIDPEWIGWGLPEWSGNGGAFDDFQDIPLWRTLTRETIEASDQALPTTTIVVAMTLLRPEYFDEVVGQLRHAYAVAQVCLTASPQVVLVPSWTPRTEASRTSLTRSSGGCRAHLHT